MGKEKTPMDKFLIFFAWIVIGFIVVYIILILTGYFLSSVNNKEVPKTSCENLGIDSNYCDYDYEEERVQEFLEEDNYEVFSVNIGNFTTNAPFFEWYEIEDDTICSQGEESCYTDKMFVIVEMKSLGSRKEQIWDALINLNVIVPEAYEYTIIIKSPTDTCKYVLFNDYGIRDWFASYNIEDKETIEYQIENSVSCE